MGARRHGTLPAVQPAPRRRSTSPRAAARAGPGRRASVRLHDARNRQYYVDKARARQQRVVAETRDWLIGYLETHPCVDCGITATSGCSSSTTAIRTTKAVAVAVLATRWATASPGYRPRSPSATCAVPTATGSGPTSQRGWWGARTGAPGRPRSQGAPGKIRTCSLLIRSQTLYPLSYGRSGRGRPRSKPTRPSLPVRIEQMRRSGQVFDHRSAHEGQLKISGARPPALTWTGRPRCLPPRQSLLCPGALELSSSARSG